MKKKIQRLYFSFLLGFLKELLTKYTKKKTFVKFSKIWKCWRKFQLASLIVPCESKIWFKLWSFKSLQKLFHQIKKPLLWFCAAWNNLVLHKRNSWWLLKVFNTNSHYSFVTNKQKLTYLPLRRLKVAILSSGWRQ